MVPCLWAVASGLRRLQEVFRNRDCQANALRVSGGCWENRAASPLLATSLFGFAAYSLRGFKQFLTDIFRNPGFAKRILGLGVKKLTEMARVIIEEAGVNAVWLGDLGDRNGPSVSPRLYGEILQPFDREVCGTHHKLGVYVFLHSHGNLNLILDKLVEAGFDGLNPLDEAENMDVASVKKNYGGKVL